MGSIIEGFSRDKMETREEINTEYLQKKYAEIWDKIRFNKTYTQKDAVILARDIVMELRKTMGKQELKDVPAQTPILGLVRSLGFTVYKDSSLPSNISGRIEVDGNKKLIRINTREPWGHQRFVIAHELGHYLMHSGLIQGNNYSYAYKDDYTKNPKKEVLLGENKESDSPARNSQKERCADVFAAELLMPRDLFVQRYLFYTNNEEFNPGKNRIVTIRCLSQAFRTKTSCIERRIQEIMAA